MKKRKSIIGAFLVIVVLIIITFYLVKKDNKIIEIPNKENKKIIDIKFKNRIDDLNNYNYKDMFVLGWLQVQGTNIDLPIFSSMLPFMEERGDFKVDINYGWRSPYYVDGDNRMSIIGHNMLNVSSKPITNSEHLTDFEDLMKFVYYDFAKNNLYIKYTSDDVEEIYAIYSVAFYDYSEDVGTSYNSDEDIKYYIDNTKDRSIYDYAIDVNETDEIISIVTCTRFFGLNKLNQFKIDARKLRKDEKTYNYKVTKNKNYDSVLGKLENNES